jgi:hypothetical protein
LSSALTPASKLPGGKWPSPTALFELLRLANQIDSNHQTLITLGIALHFQVLDGRTLLIEFIEVSNHKMRLN